MTDRSVSVRFRSLPALLLGASLALSCGQLCGQDPSDSGGDGSADGGATAELSAEQVIADLKARWQAEPEERIATAEVEVEYFRVLQGSRRQISIERMREFLDDLRTVRESSGDAADVREFSRSLGLEQKRFPNAWMSGRIVQRGTEIRNSFTGDLMPGAFHSSHDTSYSGGVDVFYVVESNQASLFPVQSQWARFPVQQLRATLPINWPLKVVNLTPEVVQLRVALPSSEGMCEVDRASGGVRWLRLNRGRSAKDRWQCGFSEFEADDGAHFTFPAISATIEYYNGFVTNCFLFIIKSIRLNHPLAEDAFHVPVPAGTNVIYFPGAAQIDAASGTTLSEAMTNVAAMLPEMQKRAETRPWRSSKPAPLPPRSRWWWWIVGINSIAILVLILGIGLVRRRQAT